jgi:hypothetical protein
VVIFVLCDFQTFFIPVKQIIQMLFTSGVSERVALAILDSNDEILAISVMDKKGNTLATMSKESFRERFSTATVGDKYGGTLAVAALGVVNEMKDIAGDTHAIITLYDKCKMMLLPIPYHEILVGLVLQLSAKAEDYYNLSTKIDSLLNNILKPSD